MGSLFITNDSLHGTKLASAIIGMFTNRQMDAGDFDSLDLIELVMALEDEFPDLKFPPHASRDDIIRVIEDRFGDDPDAGVAAVLRRKGPSGRGGAAATPDDVETRRHAR